MVSLGPADFMPRVPATGGTGMSGFGATSWSQSGAILDFGLWCQQLERMGTQCQLLEWVQVSAASYWGGNGVRPENQLLGRPV